MAERVVSMFADWVLALKNLFLPVFCKSCGRRLMTEENGFFCPTCWEQSRRIQPPFCTTCGRPHPGMVGLGMRINFPCARCREAGPQPYRRIYGAASYEGAVAEAVKLLKFQRKLRLVAPLSEVMTCFAEQEIDRSAYSHIIPVPLHTVRQRDRGFNQSRLLAEAILPQFDGAQLDQSLRRVRPTHAQSRLTTEAARRANVAGAFAAEATHLADRTVLLVDDVVTTGGTVAECAAVLRRAGVGTVDVFALALAGTADSAPRLGE